MLTVGVDPGLTGAVGFLRNGEYMTLFDMVTTLKGSGSVKQEVDPIGLRRQFFAQIPQLEEDLAIALERVSAMPGQGSSSVFSFGDTYGCCRSVASLTGYPLHLVTPATWKKHFGLGRDKEESRALASRLFPKAELHLKKHADRAEALLIARWLWDTQFK